MGMGLRKVRQLSNIMFLVMATRLLKTHNDQSMMGGSTWQGNEGNFFSHVYLHWMEKLLLYLLSHYSFFLKTFSRPRPFKSPLGLVQIFSLWYFINRSPDIVSCFILSFQFLPRWGCLAWHDDSCSLPCVLRCPAYLSNGRYNLITTFLTNMNVYGPCIQLVYFGYQWFVYLSWHI